MQDKVLACAKKDYKNRTLSSMSPWCCGPVAGMPATWICEQAGVKLPEGKDVLLFELDKKNIGENLKTFSTFSVYKAKDRSEGVEIVEEFLTTRCRTMLVSIGSQADPFVVEYGDAVKASRVLLTNQIQSEVSVMFTQMHLKLA